MEIAILTIPSEITAGDRVQSTKCYYGINDPNSAAITSAKGRVEAITDNADGTRQFLILTDEGEARLHTCLKDRNEYVVDTKIGRCRSFINILVESHDDNTTSPEI